jgi:Rrf2 family protein
MPLYAARVEYALHTLLNLALARDETAPSARDLADFQRLPLAFVRKLLTELEKAGLVAAREGAHGGWRLARPPEAITVLAVIEAVQPGDELFECREIRARCALWPDGEPPRSATAGVCTIHAVLLGAETAMRRELAAHTVADVARRVGERSPRFVAATAPEWFAGRRAARGAR